MTEDADSESVEGDTIHSDEEKSGRSLEDFGQYFKT